VADYFDLRQRARNLYEAEGKTAPLRMREKLDVYIHFVQEVSTLTREQLDTPDPVIFVRPIIADVATVNVATTAPAPPTLPTPPRRFDMGMQSLGVRRLG
jgi:hypothetical protein